MTWEPYALPGDGWCAVIIICRGSGVCQGISLVSKPEVYHVQRKAEEPEQSREPQGSPKRAPSEEQVKVAQGTKGMWLRVWLRRWMPSRA